MSTLIKTLAVFFLLTWTANVRAGENAAAPETRPLKAEMRELMRDFQGLEAALGLKPLDYAKILAALEDMDAHARAAQALKPKGHPPKDFEKLFRDIEDFKKSARAKDKSATEDSMSRLAENCFRCHLGHR